MTVSNTSHWMVQRFLYAKAKDLQNIRLTCFCHTNNTQVHFVAEVLSERRVKRTPQTDSFQGFQT